MSEMVERVARAQFANAYADHAGPGDVWDALRPEERGSWLRAARAAIEAMREPTEAMLLNRYGENSGFEGPSVHEAKLTWRFMIDAAASTRPG